MWSGIPLSTHFSAPQPQPAPRAAVRRMLVVDDDVDLQHAIARIASWIDPDLVVDGAEDVEVARAILGAREYLVVVADYLLEGRSTGLALWSELSRSRPETVFALTSAYAGARDLLERATGDRELFLPKPFDLGQLRRFLERALARAHVATGSRGGH